MKNLFWKKQEISFSDSSTIPFKLEPGLSVTYVPDINSYILITGPSLVAPPTSTSTTTTPPPEKQEPVKKNPFSAKGAFSAPVEKPLPLVDTVYVLQASTLKWRLQPCTGKHPTRRVFYYCVYEAPHLIFSYGSDKKPCNDLFVLNVNTWMWRKMIFFPEAPPGRLHGSFVVLKDRKYLIAGTKIPETGNSMLSDIWSLNLDNVNWETKNDGLMGGVWANIDFQNPDGEWTGLKHFTASAVGDEAIFIYGGFSLENEVNGKCFLFNPKDKTVKVIETKGAKPSPRGKHKALTLKKDILCVFGGQPTHDMPSLLRYDCDFYLYHHSTATWEKPLIGGTPPIGMDFFCFASTGAVSLNEVLLLGYGVAGDPNQQYNLAELKKQQEYSFTRLPGPTSTSTIVPSSSVGSKKSSQIFDIGRHNNSLEAEISQGYRLTEAQRLKVEDLEDSLLKIRAQNSLLKNKLDKQNQQIRQTEEDLAEEQRAHTISQEGSPARHQGLSAERHHHELNSRLLKLLVLEHKKRRYLETKSQVLQKTIKDAEKLVVMMDGFSEEDQKAAHIRMMKEFRTRVEGIWNKEKLLRKEVSSKFNQLGLDIKKLMDQSLSEEEHKLLKYSKN